MLLVSPLQGSSQQYSGSTDTRILFLLDASQSMYGIWQGERKYQIARQVLSQALDSLATHPNVEVALRVYGHLHPFPPQNCNDTKLEVPFAPGNTERIKEFLKTLKPSGTSPIARSLSETEHDFPTCRGCRNLVILITDGLEECSGDICEVSRELQEKKIFLKPYIIGLGQDMEGTYDCAGTYFNATDKQEFRKAVNVIISRVLNASSLQVNLLDQNGRPTETNVAMTIIEQNSGNVMDQMVHTLNAAGVPDTILLSPENTYSITIHSLPPVTINDIQLTKGKHTIVAASCARGALRAKLNSQTQSNVNPAILVSTDLQSEPLNIQYPGQEFQYLQGKYSLRILTLPEIVIEEVNLRAGETTTIQIENPGILSIQKNIKGYGSIFTLSASEEPKWVTDLDADEQSPANYYLQPGDYVLVFRSRFADQMLQSKRIRFSISPLKTTRIKL